MQKLKERPQDLKRLFYSQQNNPSQVTVVCVAGIHGNEPAGIKGLQRVITKLEKENMQLQGNFYALMGNMNAYKKGVRYLDVDLNRQWSIENIASLKQNKHKELNEYKEQKELYAALKEILNANNGPFVFLDLHTTSSSTIPFITISDSINNRKLASNFGLPIVLGIEEYLDGPLLTFINEFGHTSLGFEAGQHEDQNSIKNCKAFIWLILEKLNLIELPKVYLKKYNDILNVSGTNNKPTFYEIIYRYQLKPNALFKMISGINNFDVVKKKQILAYNGFKEIKASTRGFAFMPLYQDKGDDGFFIVRRISKFWLSFSMILRQLKVHNLLRFLPGVKQHPEYKYCLIVNKKAVKILAIQIFHLFGYRKKKIEKSKILFIKRDRKIMPLV